MNNFLKYFRRHYFRFQSYWYSFNIQVVINHFQNVQWSYVVKYFFKTLLSLASWWYGIDTRVVLCVRSTELVKVVLDNVRLRVPKDIPQFLAQINKSHFIDCDQQRAAQFQNKFGPLTNDDDAKQFRIAATELLSIANIVLNELGIRFWISSGTCLGEWQRKCVGHLLKNLCLNQFLNLT